ncbi:MAG TPA: TerB family tellurite resistance protein [Nevskiaceae bacterium]|nr:TerB family tellurite resistance protein [Nevskiaceae bacterium]
MQLNTLVRRLRTLAAPGQVPTEAIDERLATALLLAELARADDHVEDRERVVISELLATHFDLQPAEVAALMERAAVRDEQAASLYQYIKALNARLDYPGRCALIEMLWEVAWADGHLDPDEEYQLRKIAGLLYVADDDFVRAKLRAVAASHHAPPGAT